MAKLCVPQSNCGGIDVNGTRYRARNGYLEVPDRLVKHLKVNGECFEPARTLTRVPGWVCEACGFHALLRTCGRCGGQCHRPEEVPNGQEA